MFFDPKTMERNHHSIQHNFLWKFSEETEWLSVRMDSIDANKVLPEPIAYKSASNHLYHIGLFMSKDIAMTCKFIKEKTV